jgi:DNA-binding response OmpR family regulator
VSVPGRAEGPRVLCVDDDRDIAEIVQAVLTDEGYSVSCLYDLADDGLRRAVGRIEPDVVLLDGIDSTGYGKGWDIAAELTARSRAVPVVMFTAHHAAVAEARKGTSQRATDAGFAAVVEKPFLLDDLLMAVSRAAGRSRPFDRSRRAENARTKALVEALTRHRARDIRPSKMREWVLFRDTRNRIVQLYWWQQRGVYQVGRYDESGRMRMVNQFVELDAAIEFALP